MKLISSFVTLMNVLRKTINILSLTCRALCKQFAQLSASLDHLSLWLLFQSYNYRTGHKQLFGFSSYDFKRKGLIQCRMSDEEYESIKATIVQPSFERRESKLRLIG